MADDIIFQPPPDYEDTSESVAITDIASVETDVGPKTPFPEPIIKISQERKDEFLNWVDQWLESMIQAHNAKVLEWSAHEVAYRALPEPPKVTPFIGACTDVIPVIAMAVDPIHARLDTGIFKNDPVIRLKALRQSWQQYIKPLEIWLQYYQKHRLDLRRIISPALLELTKHGTMVMKTVYDVEKYPIKTYDKSWNVIDQEVTRFKGPRITTVSINDFLFPPNYQDVQLCPIVAQRMRLSMGDLKIAEKSGKIKNVKMLEGQDTNDRTDLELTRQESANHLETTYQGELIEVYEIWCDYDIDNDGIPERLVCTYERNTRTILQLRYNWYFHQRKPFTVVPYSIVNGSLYGLGICEMSLVFQSASTKWHQVATDNAYLANIRMFIAKTESNIEEVPKLYSGRVFFVDNPKEDFIPFQAGDIYNSTLEERQNILGLAEKRTGVSDYLTGRESPIVGSRATATSTLALIQEGTRRVEEVMENVRAGIAEVFTNCIYIWIQYGLDGLDDLVFDDDVSDALKQLFSEVSELSVDGAFGVDLAATDAANNRSVQQQAQLAVIQVMMQYLEKLVSAGQMAIEAAQGGQTDLAALVGDVMSAARKMFRDLLDTHDIPNADEYLPDLEKHLNAALAAGQGGPPGPGGPTGGPPALGGIQANGSMAGGETGGGPPGVGGPNLPGL